MRRKRERDKVEGCVSRSLLRFAPIVSCFLSLKPLSLSPHLSQEQPGRTQVLVYADELVDLEGGHEREARGGRERPASSCCSRHRRRRRKINAGGRRKKVKFFFFFRRRRQQHLLLTFLLSFLLFSRLSYFQSRESQTLLDRSRSRALAALLRSAPWLPARRKSAD